jgi:hypothetical protein
MRPVPIPQERGDIARAVIAAYEAMPTLERDAKAARQKAERVELEGFPEQVIAAYRVLADEADAKIESNRRFYDEMSAKLAGG